MRFRHNQFLVSSIPVCDWFEICIFDDDRHESEVVERIFSCDEDARERAHKFWCEVVQRADFSLPVDDDED